MEMKNLVYEMCASRGKTMRGVSIEMGKDPSYLFNVTKSNSIRVNACIEMCDMLGYALAAKGHGATVVFRTTLDMSIRTLSKVCRLLGYRLCTYDRGDTSMTYYFE